MTLISFLLVSFVTFSLSSFSSGDLSLYILGESATAEDYEALSLSLGYDRPFFLRYLDFMRSFFTFDWGYSVEGYDVFSLIIRRLSVTLEILVITLFLSLSFSVLISCLSVRKERGLLDRSTDILLLILFSLPSFSLALILMLLFSVIIPIFPIGISPGSFFRSFRSLFLPSLSLALMHSALYIRVFRKSLKDEMRKHYVLFARARGESETRIILTEVFKPAAITLLSLSASSAATLIAGSAVTESVFSVPGLGSLIVSLSLQRDTKSLTIIIMLISFVISMISIASRILVSCLDPRAGRENEE